MRRGGRGRKRAKKKVRRPAGNGGYTKGIQGKENLGEGGCDGKEYARGNLIKEGEEVLVRRGALPKKLYIGGMSM